MGGETVRMRMASDFLTATLEVKDNGEMPSKFWRKMIFNIAPQKIYLSLLPSQEGCISSKWGSKIRNRKTGN